MIRTQWQARDYAPEKVVRRYVRMDPGQRFRFCEVGADARYDLRQGAVDETDLPADVAAAARLRAGHFPSYVEWPITELSQ